MKLEPEIHQAEVEAIKELYMALPMELTRASDKPMGKLLMSHNIAASIVGKLLTVTSALKLTEHSGQRGGLCYRRTQDSISTAEAIQVVDNLHLQPGLSTMTVLRSTRIKPRKKLKIETTVIKPLVHSQPKEDTIPELTSPVIQGEFGKSYFFITKEKFIGYGRLETIQAVFEEDTIIGYRYEIIYNSKSYIVENLYDSVIEALKTII